MDIKLENVLVSDVGSLKFCDFGFSTPVNKVVKQRMGTDIYMAPEVHWATEIPCKPKPADIFSLGVLFFILAFGAPPFHQTVSSDCFLSFMALQPGSIEFFKYHPHTRHLYEAGQIPVSFMNLLVQMLMVDPEHRLADAADVLALEVF